MSIKRITLVSFIIAGLIAIPLAVMRAQSNEIAGRAESLAQELDAQYSGGGWYERLRELQFQRLEGSWDVTVTPVVPPGVPQPPSFMAHGTFSRGGGSFGSDRTRPFSKQHGSWTHRGGNEFAWTSTEDLFDAARAFTGTLTVRVRATVTGRNEFVGVSNGEFRDAAGNVTRSGCGTVRGERIKIEPLPDQCQSVTPPQ
jgi:hypothetical protein